MSVDSSWPGLNMFVQMIYLMILGQIHLYIV